MGTITNCKFENIYSVKGYGGGLRIKVSGHTLYEGENNKNGKYVPPDLIIKDSIFKNCSATYGGVLSLFFSNVPTFTFEGNTLKNNKVSNEGNLGYNFLLWSSSLSSLYNCPSYPHFKDMSDDDTSVFLLYYSYKLGNFIYSLETIGKGIKKEDNIYVGSFSDDNDELKNNNCTSE